MDAEVLGAAGQALLMMIEPHRMFFLFVGVCAGLALGILPGIGGVAGTALLLPFTFNMDPATAMGMLLGLGATTTTADPISAIVLGAPGHAASAATALDGFPMTKRGDAGRALGAAYMSALMGGLFGAALMGLCLPIMRPLILYIGSPELLALAVFGISMVASLSGNAPLKGVAAACLGMMISMIGSDPQTGTLRWTGDSLYLWEGMPLVPLTLGIFALPELCDLAISRTSIVMDPEAMKFEKGKGLWAGCQDCFKHWFLVLRCSWIGSVLGAVPGIGVSVIDWISYGHALRSEKGAAETFGKGDVRGVIAAESATNSREGGALVPTVVFGVPSSPGMAILLGAFMIHGLVPGPEMLTKNLAITYSMVWSIAIANIMGSGLCFLFSGQFAKLATLRFTLIMPVVMSLIYIGAFEGHRNWGDLYALFAFGIFGWGMKHLKWPRPPLVLGFILGEILERYLFISIERYGTEWMGRPVVIVLFAMAALTLFRPVIQDVRTHGGLRGLLSGFTKPHFEITMLFPAAILIGVTILMTIAMGWNFKARIVPVIVGTGALIFCALSLLNQIFRKPDDPASVEREAGIKAAGNGKIHMDVVTNIGHLPTSTKLIRGALFFAWMLAFMTSMGLIGLIPTVPLFIVSYMRIEGREPWHITLTMALCMTGLIYVLFDQLLTIPWPPSVLGDFFPAMKAIPSV